ncbi:hypothetical protein H8356DRAFT_961901 [Neocallimastix lanati (nom. inval.)]|jgi:hypothetical protein|nr:hypothetical protein H8356DRAFT_961901 [Neocallimastix sp. JGI-2020a]
MKLPNLSYILLSSIPVVFSYENSSTGQIQIPSDVPEDCLTLYKIYEYFNLGRPGYIVGNEMLNCCYYEVRRLHSENIYATTEWECENDSQNPNNHITSIILNNKNLSGEIPWDIIKNFSNLQILYLNDNQLTGDIRNLSSLSNLQNIQRINLSSNKLTGTLPNELPPNLSLINTQNNDIEGPIPESWTTRQNFICSVPQSICKPKSISTYNSMCNSSPSSVQLSECTEEQMSLYNNVNSPNNPNTFDANSNDNQIQNVINTNNGDNSKVPNGKEGDSSSPKKKTSHAVIYTFFSIIGILAVIVIVVACFAKYKNDRHEREMEISLRNHREALQRIQNIEDSFLRDTAVKSVDENENFTLSKYSESVNSGSHHVGSDVGSRGNGGNGSVHRGESEINHRAKEHAILMNNIDGSNEEIDENDVNLKTIELEHSYTEPSVSYSRSTNKYNTTSSSLYDTSYSSTYSYSAVSSVSSLNIDKSSFMEDDTESSDSLSYTGSNFMNNGSVNRNGHNDEINSNMTVESSTGLDGRNYLTKRSVISSSSYKTLINQYGSNNNFTTTNTHISSSNSITSSPATLTIATPKLLEEDNLKIVLEDIEEETSPNVTKLSSSLDLSEDLGKGLNRSFVMKDSSFFNDNNKLEDAILLNW